MLEYDERRLTERLAALQVPARVAFAAACAERLFQGYASFAAKTGGSDIRIRSLLDRVWNHLAGHFMSDDEVGQAIDQAMRLIPDEDDDTPWVETQAYADDCASAVAYTLRTIRNGEPQEAAWAARRAYDSMDHLAQHAGTEGEGALRAHAAVQAELERQDADLLMLASAGNIDEVVTRMRERARVASLETFGNVRSDGR